jgi:uncharacterized membrane protein
MKMDFKTVKEFHWLTKIVILLTVFVVILVPIVALIASMLGFSIDGLGNIMFSFTYLLINLFLVILVIIIIYMIITKVKLWIEKYMDAMLSKMELLAENRNTGEDTSARLAVMGSKIEEIEKKVDGISDILEKVSD